MNDMRVYGIDFTSSPSKRKPITCLECELLENRLTALNLSEWTSFEQFESGLKRPGPWIAGIDFPFGQARRFVETIGWPDTWLGYVSHAASLSREEFVDTLNGYRTTRQPGDKEHRRSTDKKARSISPQKLYGVPVGKMFYEGAPRLIDAGVTVPGLRHGDSERIVVEAYPGVLARYLIGTKSYKNDSKPKQTPTLRGAREEIFHALAKSKAFHEEYGISISAPVSLIEDPTGDSLDALLCAIQASWAWTKRLEGFGMPENTDPLEGWISDPMPPAS